MLNTDGRHEALQEFRDAFEFDHLREGLPRVVAASYHDHAARLLALLPDGPALTRAIHDLWRSKNESVRFAVRLESAEAPRLTFRSSAPPSDTEPVERTKVDAQDRHPDHRPGRKDRPDVPKMQHPESGVTFVDDSGNPIDITTYGNTDRVLRSDDTRSITRPPD